MVHRVNDTLAGNQLPSNFSLMYDSRCMWPLCSQVLASRQLQPQDQDIRELCRACLQELAKDQGVQGAKVLFQKQLRIDIVDMPLMCQLK